MSTCHIFLTFHFEILNPKNQFLVDIVIFLKNNLIGHKFIIRSFRIVGSGKQDTQTIELLNNKDSDI